MARGIIKRFKNRKIKLDIKHKQNIYVKIMKQQIKMK
jgi:hypothetical protein